MGLIKWLFGSRSSLENPAVSLANPPDWVFDAFGGGESASGIAVNSGTVIKYSPVWKGVNLISRDVAKLPLYVYSRADSGKERAPSHPAYGLLRYKFCNGMNAYQAKLFIQAQAIIRGNGYACILRRGKAEPHAIVPLDSSKVTPIKVSTDGGHEWQMWYVLDGKTATPIPGRDILHIRGMGTDLEGYALADVARESLGLGMAAQKYGAVFFKNGARPSVVIKHPGRLSDDALKHLRESFVSIQGGIENQHKPAIMEEGMDLQPFSMNSKDAQFLETRQFEVREVANWLLMQPHKLGDTSRTSYNSLEQENQSYLDETLDPWLVCWEMECREKLLTEPQKQRDTHVIEFMRQALVRADMAARSTFYHNALLDGWMQLDEVRSRENLNAYENDGGKISYIPQNVAVLKADGTIVPANKPDGDAPDAPQDGDGTDTDDGQTAVRAAHAELIADVLRRMIRRVEGSQKPGELRDVIVEALSRPLAAATASLKLDCTGLGPQLADSIIGGERDAATMARQSVGLE